MNHYRARQRLDGNYDFTCANGKRIIPVGYCRAYADLSSDPNVRQTLSPQEQAIRVATRHKHHSCGHATPEEAEACYREYSLDHHLVLNREYDGVQHNCQVCGCWTNLHADVDMQRFTLCAEHNNRQQVELLMVGASEVWSS
jgi:hypothetical protein